MNDDTHIALALADTMLAGEASLEALIDAAYRVFDASLPWVPGVCAGILARTNDNFHYFNRHELAAIFLEHVGRMPEPEIDDEDDGDVD